MKKQRKLNLRKVNVATINNLTNIVGGLTNPNGQSETCDTVIECDTAIGCDTNLNCDTVDGCEPTGQDTCNVTKKIAFSNFGVCGAC